ncbi:MAG: exonuclease domain-containing protein [Desulfobacterales bacterium]
MRTRNRFWWFVMVGVLTVCLIIGVLVGFFWIQLAPAERALLLDLLGRSFIYVFTVAVMLLAGLGFAVDGVFHVYILPLSKLVEEVTLINTVNPSHRIAMQGSSDVDRLVTAINENADRVEALQNGVEERIRLAKAEAETEKNILAAFMADLPEGVLICNTDGRILFFNNRAREYLSHNRLSASSTASGLDPFMGLGRSVFTVIDKNLIVHALDEIAEKLNTGEASAAAHFVAVGEGDRLLQVETVPVLNNRRDFNGFILICNDITVQLEIDSRVNALFKSLVQKVRGSLGGIRSAIEAMLAYPQMAAGQSERFKAIIHEEALQIGELLADSEEAYSRQVLTRWPLAHMPACDLVEAIARKAEAKLGLKLAIYGCEDDIWVRVDSYSIVLAVLFLLERLKTHMGVRDFNCCLERRGRFVCLDLRWIGKPVKIETLRQWEAEELSVAGEAIPLTLRDVVGHHDAEIWSHSSRRLQNTAYLRLFLPSCQSDTACNIRSITILPESRPEFYDFDLFNQPGQSPDLDDRLLTELTYTVFDTETTGLNPRGGDRVISIGAVRIVNFRLRQEDFFDQLVDPQRPLPPESVKIHGIQPEMLKAQPPITTVLPLFQRYTEETILVAHNAAFDMLMLQLAEAETGIRFINPVLDTLLLSSVVHPSQGRHDMESISGRLGVSVVGRHTALGDAIATAEIFLKLIPLLAKQGIYTLRDARAASQKSYYARIRY